MRKFIAISLATLGLAVPSAASAAATTTVRSDGYTITITGPDSAVVGQPAVYTATCGYPGQSGPCPYGDWRMFGGPINRLGEGFGRGATGSYTARAAGSYTARYRVGASCPGSPRLACPIDTFLPLVVTTGA